MTPPLLNIFERKAVSGICLNMIVKNEQAVIVRLLDSVSPYIDSYLIVDTGSSDETPHIIHDYMKKKSIPGEVHFREWINFGHNRQEALKLAVQNIEANWLLFIDADEELISNNENWHLELEPNLSYQLEKHHGDYRYALTNLIWIKDLDWTWQGVVHEYISSNNPIAQSKLRKDVWIKYNYNEGGRSIGITQTEKYLKDAKLLESSIKLDPLNSRNIFYLAQSYRDAGELVLAHKNYELRVDVGGWDEETYIAQTEKANLCIQLNRPLATIIMEHLRAFTLRPARGEALYQLVKYLREQGEYAQGYIYSKIGKDLPIPIKDILLVRPDVYEWRLLDEFAICAYWIGYYKESQEITLKILSEVLYPAEEHERLLANLTWCNLKLREAASN